MLQRYREVENLTGHYVFFLGAYRALYILNWVYRSYHEQYYQHNWVVYGCGAIQTLLYVDFFYYFFLRYEMMLCYVFSLILHIKITVHSLNLANIAEEGSLHCRIKFTMSLLNPAFLCQVTGHSIYTVYVLMYCVRAPAAS